MRFITATCVILACASAAMAQQPPAAPAPPMSLTSSSFEDGGILADKYTAAVDKPVSPALAWQNVPAGTASFALIMHDPDNAPMKGVLDTTHWVIFNIPATVTSLPEGVPNDPQLADGSVQIKSSATAVGFRGPAFRGTFYHHYTFELYALDTKLALGPDASRQDVLKAMDGHIIGKAVDEVRFHRPPQ
jgi:Raf kinase inhibitor-like YbhB/YbcL family protein